MLEKKDLQAIATMLKETVRDEVAQAEHRIMQGAAALMDAEFKKHFKLLGEQQEAALCHVATDDDLDIIDGRLDTLEAMVKKHSKEIAALKKAN